MARREQRMLQTGRPAARPRTRNRTPGGPPGEDSKDRRPAVRDEDRWLPFGPIVENPESIVRQRDNAPCRSSAEEAGDEQSSDGGTENAQPSGASTDAETGPAGEDASRDEAGQQGALPPGWIPL